MAVMLFSFLLLLLNGSIIAANYSIYYYNENVAGSDLINAGTMSFVASPTPLQIADIFARISGRTPLLSEEELNMPSRDNNKETTLPYLIEIRGGGPAVLSNIKDIKPVIKARANQLGLVSPSLGHVIQALDVNDIHLTENKDYTTMKISDSSILNHLATVLSQKSAEGRPVVMLLDNCDSDDLRNHNNIQKLALPARKHLAADSENPNADSNGIKPLTEFQISQYQIGLWTAVVMTLLLLAAVCSIVQMEVIPDSLLSAKFQSGRTGGKFD